jgi:DNA-binding transcriptional ArsR family regulator
MIAYSVIDAYLVSLDATAWKVYLALLRHADPDGVCWPSQETIAVETGLKERAVRYALIRLSEADLITIERQSGKSTIYHITPAPPCRPENEGAAPPCRSPRHDDAGTPAPPCRSPRHRHALEQDTRTRYKNKGRSACDVSIPESLNCESFQAAWGEWLAYRREKKKPVSDRAAKMQLRDLETMGPDRAITAIRHSIKSDYQGIYEPGGNGKATADTKAKEKIVYRN